MSILALAISFFLLIPRGIAAEVRIAFLGDQGIKPSSKTVLELVKTEKADAVVQLGDFDYRDDPKGWNDQLSSILGTDFPVFAVVGNHEKRMWREFLLEARLARVKDAHCSGETGLNATCAFKGLLIVLSGVGTSGKGHIPFLKNALETSTSPWKICAWHKNQALLQVESKGDDVGWGPYETCLKQGAMIVNGHSHVYSRTHLLSRMNPPEVAGTSSTLELSPGRTFVAVSGLGGYSIRHEHSKLARNPWWASVLTKEQDADFGALFCVFGAEGRPDRAKCYFKDIRQRVRDQFELVSKPL